MVLREHIKFMNTKYLNNVLKNLEFCRLVVDSGANKLRTEC